MYNARTGTPHPSSVLRSEHIVAAAARTCHCAELSRDVGVCPRARNGFELFGLAREQARGGHELRPALPHGGFCLAVPTPAPAWEQGRKLLRRRADRLGLRPDG